MLFQNDETMEFLKSIIRIGEVSSVDAAKGTARVVFDDFDSMVSYDLQVISRNTFANRDYAMPDIGEDVICVFLPTGTEAGFILGSVYAGEITPPENTIDRRCVEFSDGSKFMYDRTAHKFTASIGDTSITVDQNGVDVQSKSTIHAKVGGTEATIGTDGVSITGNLTVSGNISASGSASAASMSASGSMTAATVTASGALTASTAVLTTPPTVDGVPMIVP